MNIRPNFITTYHLNVLQPNIKLLKDEIEYLCDDGICTKNGTHVKADIILKSLLAVHIIYSTN
jgi:hypothetical protein